MFVGFKQTKVKLTGFGSRLGFGGIGGKLWV